MSNDLGFVMLVITLMNSRKWLYESQNGLFPLIIPSHMVIHQFE